MRVHDPGKLALLSITLIGTFVLMGMGRLDTMAGLPVITGVMGYLTGNGVLVTNKRAPSPALVASNERMAPDALVVEEAPRLDDPGYLPRHRTGEHELVLVDDATARDFWGRHWAGSLDTGGTPDGPT